MEFEVMPARIHRIRNLFTVILGAVESGRMETARWAVAQLEAELGKTASEVQPASQTGFRLCLEETEGGYPTE
jgi:hypothetical protein